jgi:hypothetical protein
MLNITRNFSIRFQGQSFPLGNSNKPTSAQITAIKEVVDTFEHKSEVKPELVWVPTKKNPEPTQDELMELATKAGNNSYHVVHATKQLKSYDSLKHTGFSYKEAPNHDGFEVISPASGRPHQLRKMGSHDNLLLYTTGKRVPNFDPVRLAQEQPLSSEGEAMGLQGLNMLNTLLSGLVKDPNSQKSKNSKHSKR